MSAMAAHQNEQKNRERQPAPELLQSPSNGGGGFFANLGDRLKVKEIAQKVRFHKENKLTVN